MRVLLFGATGMVGQGVLRECLLAPDVEQVVAVVRRAGLPPHEKLREVVHADMGDLAAIADDLAACDACFYCLGVSATGMKEADYTRVTYDYTLAAAKLIAERRPGTTFIYVSGQGTNEHARAMWSRVKGRTERDVLALPLRAVMFRPGLIRPMHGIKSRTRLYRIGYYVLWPIMPLFALFGSLTTTERVGLAMLRVARGGSDEKFVTNKQMNALAAAP